MPRGKWFSAVAGLFNLWESDADELTFTLTTDPTSFFLDLNGGSVTLIVKVNGIASSGVQISIANPLIASISAPQSGGLGLVVVNPLTEGTTSITVGPFVGAPAITIPITVVDVEVDEFLSVSPMSPVSLDLRTGGKTFVLTLGGEAFEGAAVSTSNALVAQSIDFATDDRGQFRIEPKAIGTATITIMVDGESLDEEIFTGGDQLLTIGITVTDIAVTTGVSTIRINESLPVLLAGGIPQPVHVLDQHLAPLPGASSKQRVQVEVDPPYILASMATMDGRLSLVPVGVGEGKVVFRYDDPVNGQLELQQRFEVIP